MMKAHKCPCRCLQRNAFPAAWRAGRAAEAAWPRAWRSPESGQPCGLCGGSGAAAASSCSDRNMAEPVGGRAALSCGRIGPVLPARSAVSHVSCACCVGQPSFLAECRHGLRGERLVNSQCSR